MLAIATFVLPIVHSQRAIAVSHPSTFASYREIGERVVRYGATSQSSANRKTQKNLIFIMASLDNVKTLIRHYSTRKTISRLCSIMQRQGKSYSWTKANLRLQLLASGGTNM